MKNKEEPKEEMEVNKACTLFTFVHVPLASFGCVLFVPLVRFMLPLHYIITEPKTTKEQTKLFLESPVFFSQRIMRRSSSLGHSSFITGEHERRCLGWAVPNVGSFCRLGFYDYSFWDIFLL